MIVHPFLKENHGLTAGAEGDRLSQVVKERLEALGPAPRASIELLTPLRMTTDGKRQQLGCSNLLHSIARRMRAFCRSTGVTEPAVRPHE